MNKVWRLTVILAAVVAPLSGANATVIVDQSNPVDVGGFSFLDAGTTSQSFVAGLANSVGAGIFLNSDYGSYTGNVSLSLWTNTPADAASIMLASGTAVGTTGQWADVFWGQVGLTAGNTYNIRATADQPLVVSYGGQYAGGSTWYNYQNNGMNYYESFDLTFRTFSETDVIAAVPEPGTWAMMLIGFGGMGVALRRRRKSTTIAQFA